MTDRELFQRAYQAWNKGGPEAAQEYWADDYEWHDPPNLPDAKIVRGRDAAVTHLREVLSLLGDLELRLVEMRWREKTVAARFEMVARGSASGVNVAGEQGQVVDIGNGEFKRTRGFFSWPEALAAAGFAGAD